MTTKWIQLIIVFVLGAWLVTKIRTVEKFTDEQTVSKVLDEVRKVRPELVPIETMYIDPDGSSRFLFLNTDTYAGEVYDYSKKQGVIRDVQGINDKPKLYDYVKV